MMIELEFALKQFLITPAAGKRLIAMAIAAMPEIEKAVREKTVVIIAGTTNAYVAEELLKLSGQVQEFSREHFFRGITLPPDYSVNKRGRLDDGAAFPGDVVIRKGVWEKGLTIDDVADDL